MADWILVPCLVQLRTEFNRIAPGRDKASDGSKGDDAHAETSSDHNPDETGNVPIRDVDRLNEVHALDVDKDLRTPGLDMEKVVQFLLGRCRAGTEKRLRYIIWHRRIWRASNSWRQETYTGKNAHTEHGHFSASYETKYENDKSSWGIEEEFEVIDYDKIRAIVRDEIDQRIDALTAETVKPDGEKENPIGRAALIQPIPNPFKGKRTDAYVLHVDTAEAVKDLVDKVTELVVPIQQP
jgi:hypothetical protein